ncbi:antibiotic biosynthesis monooxygenase, partial [Staphylococcus pseudintermedius]|nr:antibiotic biosynthesis monooxygenase [Staphylococcus pseudintermedius]EGQ2880901.1 antibiotic biosynthesis monooxygenase [Staphylococcus pseudintermedius]
ALDEEIVNSDLSYYIKFDAQ